ncbi:MAG TPA: glycosyltransferase family 4 protein [Ensifer sp.]|nr:glycosyltransferase family 4 protein [Ensifer sp.]
MMLRVLIVSQYFFPEEFPINSVVADLRRRNIEVEILTGKPNYPQGTLFEGYKGWGLQREQFEGATIHRVPIIPRGRKSGARLALNYLSYVVSGLLLAPWMLRRRKFDVVFVYGISPILQAIPALFLGWLKSAPTVVWVQDLWPESLSATGYLTNPRMLGWVRHVVQAIYRKSDRLLVQSLAFIGSVRQMAPDTQIDYFPNSVGSEFLSSGAVDLPEIGGLESPFPVVFAGNIGSAQAVDVILEAAKLLRDEKDIQFVIVGDGSERAWLQQQVEKHGLKNMSLPGRLPVAFMPALMRKASVLLVSLRNEPIFELTTPSKVQAYLASGRPIVASLNGEGARIIHEAQAGLAAPAGNADALKDAILTLYRMPVEERVRLGHNGQDYYKANFAHDMLADRLVELFQSTIKEKKAPR